MPGKSRISAAEKGNLRFRPQDGILRPGDGRDIRFVSRILYSFRGFKPNWLFTNPENSDIIPDGFE